MNDLIKELAEKNSKEANEVVKNTLEMIIQAKGHIRNIEGIKDIFEHIITYNNIELTEYFLNKGFNINHGIFEDQYLVTPLLLAAKRSTFIESENFDENILGILIKAKAIVDYISPIESAIEMNGPFTKNVIKYLISKGFEINPEGSTRPPILGAIKKSIEIYDAKPLETVIELGASVNVNNGTSPLNYAISFNNGSGNIIAKFLINIGAEFHGSSSNDLCIDPPLFAACRHNNLEMFKYLLQDKECDIDNKTALAFLNTYSSDKKEYYDLFLTRIDLTHLEELLQDKAITVNCIKLVEDYFPDRIEEYHDKFFKNKVFLIDSSSKITQAFIDKGGKYPNDNTYKFGDLIIKSLDSTFTNESDNIRNKISNEVFIKDGIICEENFKFLPITSYIWTMNQHGKIFITDSIEYHHSYFRMDQGFGKPIACGGHVKIKEGKIIHINNSSGHYKPNADQLIMAVKYIHKLGILSEDVIIDPIDSEKLTLQEVLDIDANDVLSRYEELTNYPLSDKQAKNTGQTDDYEVSIKYFEKSIEEPFKETQIKVCGEYLETIIE